MGDEGCKLVTGSSESRSEGGKEKYRGQIQEGQEIEDKQENEKKHEDD